MFQDRHGNCFGFFANCLKDERMKTKEVLIMDHGDGDSDGDGVGVGGGSHRRRAVAGVGPS